MSNEVTVCSKIRIFSLAGLRKLFEKRLVKNNTNQADLSKKNLHLFVQDFGTNPQGY